MKPIHPLKISGKEVHPLIEGGKGVSISTGQSSGAWAAAGGVGTFSAVNADCYDENGKVIPQIYKGRTRRERHDELIRFAIDGGIEQARIAHDVAGGQGRLHMNVLWEMGGAETILHGILDKVKDLVHGVTCGAGMPYRVAEISAKYGVYYYPIVSSARAFRALWLRSFHKVRDLLGGVVYEDPWLAGGHNGLSNGEDPQKPEDPFQRLLALRKYMREQGLGEVPIIMAGGVWWLSEWENYIDNPDLGPVAFQYGTSPLLTKESPISDKWKAKLLSLKKGDILLNRFSPTGFYSSAVRNAFLRDLEGRSQRQVAYTLEPMGEHSEPYQASAVGKPVYLTQGDRKLVQEWLDSGYIKPLRTPDSTLVFVTAASAAEIHRDQVNCVGCLSGCHFSNWAQNEEGSTGRLPDPRSFCIQRTLQDIAHSDDAENNLMFSGHYAYRFGSDPFYANGFVPTVKELVDRILTGF